MVLATEHGRNIVISVWTQALGSLRPSSWDPRMTCEQAGEPAGGSEYMKTVYKPLKLSRGTTSTAWAVPKRWLQVQKWCHLGPVEESFN